MIKRDGNHTKLGSFNLLDAVARHCEYTDIGGDV